MSSTDVEPVGEFTHRVPAAAVAPFNLVAVR
jgi:hypothetical protein